MLGGYFFEYITDSIDSIEPVLKKPAQTIAYLGIGPEELERIVKECGPRGVDRIVPIGHTMDLSFIWDGYDMVETMSRVIQIAKPNKGGLES